MNSLLNQLKSDIEENPDGEFSILVDSTWYNEIEAHNISVCDDHFWFMFDGVSYNFSNDELQGYHM